MRPHWTFFLRMAFPSSCCPQSTTIEVSLTVLTCHMTALTIISLPLLFRGQKEFRLVGGNRWVFSQFRHCIWLTITPELYARAPTSMVKYSTHEEKWASLSLWKFTLMPWTSPTLMKPECNSGMMKIGEANLMPLLIGCWAPQWVTDDELYCASLLALLKPWRALADLHSPGVSFNKALDCFLDDNHKCRDIVDNIIHMHRMHMCVQDKF